MIFFYKTSLQIYYYIYNNSNKNTTGEVWKRWIKMLVSSASRNLQEISLLEAQASRTAWPFISWQVAMTESFVRRCSMSGQMLLSMLSMEHTLRMRLCTSRMTMGQLSSLSCLTSSLRISESSFSRFISAMILVIWTDFSLSWMRWEESRQKEPRRGSFEFFYYWIVSFL